MSEKEAKYCLVTGAAGGIGRALVEVFASAGFRVLGLDVTEQPPNLPCWKWYRHDLNRIAEDEDAALELCSSIEKEVASSGLKGLVNNAAAQILGDAQSLSRSEWRTTLNVNLLAPFYLVQGLLSALARAEGSVVNISSIHSKLSKKRFAAYATSKAALSGLTRALALELGPVGISVNSIEPAAVMTDMLREGFAGNEDKLKQLESCHPAGRIATPHEIAAMARWLVEDCPKFVHGASIPMDGGISGRLHDPD